MRKLSFVYQGARPARLDKTLFDHARAELGDNAPTRSQLKHLIEAGHVELSGVAATKAGQLLKPGTKIVCSLVEEATGTPEPMDFPLEVLYEDSELLVIDKPHGLSMHPGAGNRSRTLVNALVHHFGKNLPELFAAGARPGIVHRLDRDTTGVVVVAKSAHSHAALASQFADRSISREYRALVFRTPRSLRPINTAESGTISGNIGRDPHDRKRMAVLPKGGKPAVTHWQSLERMQHGCLVCVRLDTGRTHQIRVHMSAIGAPVIGDPVYGDFQGLPVRLRIAAEKFGRQALHAAKLAFDHPKSGKRLEFESPLPADFQKLLQIFRLEGRA